MPVHDWTRVDDGTFHAFHTSWITHLMETLNAGPLPPGYYAIPEQIASRMQTDLLTLRSPPGSVRRERHLVVRHVTGHHVVALDRDWLAVEQGSPGQRGRVCGQSRPQSGIGCSRPPHRFFIVSEGLVIDVLDL